MDGEHATIERDGSVRGGHKGSHMTAPTQRIEVITRGERRRRWSIEEKREIVAESLVTGVRPSEVIHKHGITSGHVRASVPLLHLRFRCGKCGSRLTHHVVTSKDAIGVKPWRDGLKES